MLIKSSQFAPLFEVHSLHFRKKNVIVLSVTPWAVVPPLLPCHAPRHGPAYTDHGTCLTPGPHCTPLTATPWPTTPPVPPGVVVAGVAAGPAPVAPAAPPALPAALPPPPDAAPPGPCAA